MNFFFGRYWAEGLSAVFVILFIALFLMDKGQFIGPEYEMIQIMRLVFRSVLFLLILPFIFKRVRKIRFKKILEKLVSLVIATYRFLVRINWKNVILQFVLLVLLLFVVGSTILEYHLLDDLGLQYDDWYYLIAFVIALAVAKLSKQKKCENYENCEKAQSGRCPIDNNKSGECR